MRTIRDMYVKFNKRILYPWLSFGFILLTKKEHWNLDIKEKTVKWSVMTLEMNVLVHVLLGIGI